MNVTGTIENILLKYKFHFQNSNPNFTGHQITKSYLWVL